MFVTVATRASYTETQPTHDSFEYCYQNCSHSKHRGLLCVTRAEAELMTTDHSFGSGQGSQAILATWVSAITLVAATAPKPQMQLIHSQPALIAQHKHRLCCSETSTLLSTHQRAGMHPETGRDLELPTLSLAPSAPP